MNENKKARSKMNRAESIGKYGTPKTMIETVINPDTTAQ